MGSELRRQVREALGSDIKGLQRAVALELADDARWSDSWTFDPVNGRRSKARLADLVRWTASKNERVVRDALRSLALAGWEFRLPIGKGSDGRLLYAVPGLAMQYRVPDFAATVIEGFTNEGTATAGPMDTEGTVTAGPYDLEGPVTTAQGPVVTAQGPVTTAQGPVTAGPPSLVSPSSPKDSPSSSVAEDSSESIDGEVIEEEGGGDSSNGFIKRAYAFVDALDYRGKVPGRKRRTTLAMRAVAAFKAGWTEQTLADYLDLGSGEVKFAAALYLHRLGEDELPEPPHSLAAVRSLLPPACSACLMEHPGAQTNLRLRQRDGQLCPDCHPSSENVQQRQPLQATGTDATVAGWLSLAADLTEREAMLNSPTPRPSTTDQRVQQAIDAGKRLQARHDAQNGHSGGNRPTPVNGAWERVSEEATNGLRPDGADAIPHCGECDEYTRTRGDGHSLCPKCHPVLRF